MHFEGFEIDTAAARVLRDGVEIKLEPRALDMLCYLASHPERLILKEELLGNVWQARSLSPGVVANTVAKLRKALGQSLEDQTPIETVHGRGYRWRAAQRERPAPSVDPFVGGENLMQLLRGYVNSALQAKGQLALVTGEPGIGKSRLLKELAGVARAHGFRVWLGAAYEDAGAPAYWPWIEVLRAAHRDLGESAWRDHLPTGVHALARLAPDLCAGDAQAAKDPASIRFRLLDELSRLLQSASAREPILIVIDDLHWADAASIELLRHATLASQERKVLLAASVRDRDAPAHQRAALRTLGRVAHTLRLTGLARGDTALLASELQRTPWLDPEAIEWLFQRTRGNPLFVRHVIELLVQHGQPATLTALRKLEIPPGVRDLVRQRVAALGEECAALLAIAAVLGCEFDVSQLARMLAAPVEQTLATLLPAQETGLIEHESVSGHRFRFSHGLVRETLYANLPSHGRGAWHRRAVDVLDARQGQNDPQQLGSIARHALASLPFELEACMTHCQRAADAARQLGGFDVAANMLSLLFERVSAEADDRTRAELLLQLGVDQYCSGDVSAAWGRLHAGAQLARSLSDGALLARFVFGLLDCLEAGAGDSVQGLAVIDQALTLVGNGAPPLRAVLLAHRAEMASDLPFETRVALLDEADALADTGDLAPKLEIACCRANLRDPVQLEHGRVAVARLRALLESAPNALQGTRLNMKRCAAEVADYLCRLSAGELAEADKISARLRSLTAETNLAAVKLCCELLVAGRALADGKRSVVEHQLVRARELGVSVTGGLSQAWLWYSLLLMHAHGELRASSPLPLPFDLQADNSRYATRGTIMIAWFEAQRDRHEQARACLAHVSAAELARMPVLHGDVGTLCLLAETYTLLCDRDSAGRLHAQLAPYASLNAVGFCFEYHGAVAHYLGLLSGLLGRGDEAQRYAEQAREINAALGMPTRDVESAV